jgi:two-component system NtrC family response regulator
VITAGKEKTIYAMHLPRNLRIQVAQAQIKRMTGSEVTSEGVGVRKIGQEIFEDIFDQALPSLREFKGTAEKVYLGELIRQSGGDLAEILKVSGLSRSHFYSLLKKYGLSL